MAEQRSGIFADIEGELEDVDLLEIEEIICKKCTHSQEPNTHPCEQARLTCSDCGQSSKSRFEIVYEVESDDGGDAGGDTADGSANGTVGPGSQQGGQGGARAAAQGQGGVSYNDAPEAGVDPEWATRDMFKDPVEEAADRFEGFLQKMSEQMGGKMEESFIQMMRSDVVYHERLPDPLMLGNEIDTNASGISNNSQIRRIVNRYNDWLDSKKRSGELSNIAVGGSGNGGWMQGGGQQGYGGGGMGGRGQMGGGGGAPMPGGGGGMGGRGQVGGQANPQQAQMQQLRREIRRMRQDDGGQDGGEEGLSAVKQRAEELAELKAVFSQLNDDDGGGETREALERELAKVRQQGGVSEGPSPKEMVLSNMASREDVDPEQLATIMSKLDGGRSEEVEKKELEIQKKEMELEHKKERGEKMADALERAVDTIGNVMEEKFKREADNDAEFQRQDIGGMGQGGGMGGMGQMGGQGQGQAGYGGQGQNQNQQSRAQMDGGTATQDGSSWDSGGGGGGGADGGQSVQSNGDGQQATVTCGNCGDELPVSTDDVAIECGDCGWSLDECRKCHELLEIPADGQMEGVECPDCGGRIPCDADEAGKIGCIETGCEWTGDVDETGPEVVKCGGCDEVWEVDRGDGTDADGDGADAGADDADGGE